MLAQVLPNDYLLQTYLLVMVCYHQRWMRPQKSRNLRVVEPRDEYTNGLLLGQLIGIQIGELQEVIAFCAVAAVRDTAEGLLGTPAGCISVCITETEVVVCRIS